MRFEHIIRINEAASVNVPALEPGAVFRLLAAHALRPDLFDNDVDLANVIEVAPGASLRDAVLGTLRVRERIHVDPAAGSIAQAVEWPTAMHGRRRETRLEAPARGELFARFVYVNPTGGAETMPGSPFRHALESAWLAADRDLVRQVRWLLNGGGIDALLAAGLGAQVARLLQPGAAKQAV